MKLIKKSLMASLMMIMIMGNVFSLEQNPSQHTINNNQDLEQQKNPLEEPLIPQEDPNLVQSAIPGNDIVNKLLGDISPKKKSAIALILGIAITAISYAK